MSFRILVASYSNSIYTLEFDPVARSLARIASIEVGHHPSWITFHPKDRSLVFTGLEQADGKILALKYNAQGEGRVVAEAPSGGADPCSLHATDDDLLIANYSSGRVSVLPISVDAPYILTQTPITTQLSGAGPRLDRQTAPHPHHVYPVGNRILVPDLGGDRVYTFEKKAGAWRPTESLEHEAGSGPRHVACYNGVLYTLLELTSSLSAHRSGVLINTVPTMLNPPPLPNDMLAAEILIPSVNTSFPRPFIYVSNRNDPSPEGDFISIFDIEDNGAAKLVKEVRSGLKHARGMQFGGPDDKWLVVGGALGGGVKVFQRTNGGKGLEEVASSTEATDSPTGFLWM
ncbi:putative isomerase YbhE [Mucidula mucida]|nr:putative isomerase YbhE [Mucidula mucida]